MLSVSNGKGILCQHVKLFCFNILVIQILMGWFFRLHSRESGGLNRRGYVGIFCLAIVGSGSLLQCRGADDCLKQAGNQIIPSSCFFGYILEDKTCRVVVVPGKSPILPETRETQLAELI